jgi:hypothetical protein
MFCMGPKPKLISAEELDAMTPNERAAAVDACTVTDPAELPEAFRTRVFAVGERIAHDLRAKNTST